jgi:hypothetical protein
LWAAFARSREGQKSGGARANEDGSATAKMDRAAKSQDRSQGLLLLAVTVIAVLFAVIGLLSHASNPKSAERKDPNLGRPNLGQSPTQPNRGSITPLQTAETPAADKDPQVSPEDVDKTKRRRQPEPVKPEPVQTLASVPPMEDPALAVYRRQVGATPISTSPPVSAAAPVAAAAPSAAVSNPLNKSSLVFVSSNGGYQATSRPGALSQATLDQRSDDPLLPNGSRLVARLQAAVTTAVKTPVVAAIEYNYEQDGEILVPAGAKAFGELQQANKTGIVSLRFNRLEMADGTIREISGTAISLTYGPLKGSVTGNTLAQRVLVRTLAGIGATAAFLVGGPGGLSGASGGLNDSILLRERIASNAGIAGDQEITNLAVSQQLVVTVPANTRFFIVLQDDKANRSRSRTIPSGTPAAPSTPGQTQYASNSTLPTAEELRELIELKNEINRMNQQTATAQPAAPSGNSSFTNAGTPAAQATAFSATQPATEP